MSATTANAANLDPISLVDQFRAAVREVRGLKPEALANLFNRFADKVIEWCGEFLLHGERSRLRQFFTEVAQMAEGETIEPVATIIHRFAGYVTRKGDDDSVEALREALLPVAYAPVKTVSEAARHGQNWARQAYEGLVR